MTDGTFVLCPSRSTGLSTRRRVRVAMRPRGPRLRAQRLDRLGGEAEEPAGEDAERAGPLRIKCDTTRPGRAMGAHSLAVAWLSSARMGKVDLFTPSGIGAVRTS